MLDALDRQWGTQDDPGIKYLPTTIKAFWWEIFVYREVTSNVTNRLSAGKSPSTCILVRKLLRGELPHNWTQVVINIEGYVLHWGPTNKTMVLPGIFVLRTFGRIQK